MTIAARTVDNGSGTDYDVLVDTLTIDTVAGDVQLLSGIEVHDDPVAGRPVITGMYAQDDASPSAVSADGDVVRTIADRKGRQIVRSIGSPFYAAESSEIAPSAMNSLASSATAGCVTAEQDNTSNLYSDVLVKVKATMTTAGSPTGLIEVYALWSLDGTTYSGDTTYSGAAAAYTLGAAGSPNLTMLGVIKPHANTNAYTGIWSLKAALGVMPPFWAIVVVNFSAIALHSSGNSITYRGIL